MKLTILLRKITQTTAAEAYYAGSCARNIVRRKKTTETEVVITKLPFDMLVKEIKKHCNITYKSKPDGTVSVLTESGEALLRLPYKNSKPHPSNTLKDDAKSQLFTVNSMFVPMNSHKAKNVIDFMGGKDSIQKRVIRTVLKAAKVVKRDPIVMTEAIAIASELGYKLDNNLFYAIKAHHADIELVPVDIIREHFTRILLGKKPSRYLRIMHNAGLLYILIPELSACAGIDQNEKYHKYDVFEHCLAACDSTDPDIIIRLAALFHDIGKAPTRSEIEKDGDSHVTFYNHEVVGSKLVRKILRRLKFSKEIADVVSELTYNHMYNYEQGKWSDAAVRRFIKKAHIKEEDLPNIGELPIFKLRKADRAANGLNLSDTSPRQRSFENRIRYVYERSRVLHTKDLEIDGIIVMNTFNLKPGPTVGHVLNYLLGLVIEKQELNNREALIEEASKYLSKALK